MMTHKTLDAARAINGDGAVAIAEIEHSSDGRCYIRIKAAMDILRTALAVKPMPEIVALIAEHPAMSMEQAATYRISQEAGQSEDLRNNTRCHGCGKQIDGTVARGHEGLMYLGGRQAKVMDLYCDTCYNVRSAMGDWGAPVLESAHKGDM